MRRTIVLFIAATMAGSVIAAESGRKPLVDFAAYSIFLVANDNCGDLHFDAEKLKSGMDRFAASLAWSERKRRSQALAMVQDNQRQFKANPSSFCASAKRIAPRYAKDGIQYTR